MNAVRNYVKKIVDNYKSYNSDISNRANFEEMLLKLTPKLRGIANQLNGHYRHLRFIDKYDLMQEMFIYLWKKWQQGELEGKTESYLLQGCWFHLKNYLRKINDKTEVISIDKPIYSRFSSMSDGGGDEMTIGQIMSDNSQLPYDLIDRQILFEEILLNSLSKREREVFLLSLKGYTLREIGKKLNISFVRVYKIQTNICKKYKDKINT